jgi:cGMP-dependent protein kinase
LQHIINAALPRPEQSTASFDDLSKNLFSSPFTSDNSNLSITTTTAPTPPTTTTNNQRFKLKRLSSNIPSEEEAVEHISHLNMSNSASSARSSQGGPFRSLFSKLRKQSDNGQISNLQVQVGSRVYDAQEIQKLIPQLEEGIEKKDKQLRQSQSIVEAHTKKIADLEKEVKSLQRECDKLRSVLQQKAESAASPATPNQKSSHTEDLHTDLQQKAVLPTAEHPENVRSKKLAVSAEPAKLDQHKATLQHHSKSAGSKQLIRDAVQKNDFLRQLAKEQVIELVECMFEMRARAGQWVIQEGEPGDRLFVVAEGQLQVSREGTILGNCIGPGTVMGELAILYNCTRTASVQAVSDVSLWVLDRSAFQMITMRLGMERHSQLMNFLNKVSIFENLSEDRISKMADVMDQDYYAGGHYIIREGEKGDTFFVINSGQVRVTQSIEGEHEPREIRILKQGDFFGEKALLGEEVRTANVIAMNPGVEVLTLDRESFLKLIGDLEALKRDYGDSQRRATLSSRATQEQPPSPTRIAQDNEYAQLQLRQLKRIATLGVGGFGRVELVCINGDKARTFALKALKKKHIVDTRQQEHIFAERNIMLETKTDWIVRLYTTFRDSKYVYMLLEACLGGELWTTLRDRGHFDDYTARFYVACVLEGLEHLHRKNIVYRDLKPENCLLTQTGYLKLVDFGFAKKLASGRKTWTFCGTPEYVSPEIILNKGHDQAADYWALGIYICELMLGRPPFQASDPMKTYTLILKGIDALDIPNRRIGKTATALVKKLCRDNPGERLGSGSGGVNDIRKHRWFMGFDWEGLRTRALKAPIVPKVSNPADVSNFDNYPPDQDIPPDEFSGWDEGF